MIELSEAIVLAEQINQMLSGKKIKSVTAMKSPHKFAWYSGDPQCYQYMLTEKTISNAENYGGFVQINADDATILFADGVNLRYHANNDKRPLKHQLLIEFDDFTALSASVQMYGGLWCCVNQEFDNPYYLISKNKPSPFSEKFTRDYFDSIVADTDIKKLSVKALLATEQRIPGLGNGSLQDILYNAKIHPKQKVKNLNGEDLDKLYNSIKSTFAEMVNGGGRDTEKDLFGKIGGYKTKLSKNTYDKECSACGSKIIKEAYLGGSIYYCPVCQKI